MNKLSTPEWSGDPRESLAMLSWPGLLSSSCHPFPGQHWSEWLAAKDPFPASGRAHVGLAPEPRIQPPLPRAPTVCRTSARWEQRLTLVTASRCRVGTEGDKGAQCRRTTCYAPSMCWILYKQGHIKFTEQPHFTDKDAETTDLQSWHI